MSEQISELERQLEAERDASRELHNRLFHILDDIRTAREQMANGAASSAIDTLDAILYWKKPAK